MIPRTQESKLGKERVHLASGYNLSLKGVKAGTQGGNMRAGVAVETTEDHGCLACCPGHFMPHPGAPHHPPLVASGLSYMLSSEDGGTLFC